MFTIHESSLLEQPKSKQIVNKNEASGDANWGVPRTWRNQLEAALWAFSIVGWSVVAYLYHLHPSLP
jgi:hypothetical protein